MAMTMNPMRVVQLVFHPIVFDMCILFWGWTAIWMRNIASAKYLTFVVE